MTTTFMRNTIYNMDCMEGMKQIPSGAVDLILTDLPYGMTSCAWDQRLSLPELWAEYWRVLKPRGAVVLTACQPFTTQLISSCQKHFRYCWYWRKNASTGFTFAKFQPMRCMEEIAVFYRQAPTYNPQGLQATPPKLRRRKTIKPGGVYKMDTLTKEYVTAAAGYPKNLLEIPSERGLHPTQKPVKLFEYLIRTYTNPGELVLDSCMGSGTTAVACVRCGRDYIGFETSEEYCRTALKRLEQPVLKE